MWLSRALSLEKDVHPLHTAACSNPKWSRCPERIVKCNTNKKTSLVPRLYRFSMLEAMESWAEPRNKVRRKCIHIINTTVILVLIVTHTTDLGTYWLSKYGEYWLWVNHLVNWSVSKQQQQTSEVQPIYLNLDSDESDHKRETSATANRQYWCKMRATWRHLPGAKFPYL